MKYPYHIHRGFPVAALIAAMAASTPLSAADRVDVDMQGEVESSERRDVPVMNSQDISRKHVADLKGMPLTNMKGDKIGEVVAVARDTRNSNAVSVISVGGFFGIGDTRVAIPLDTLDLAGDRLVTSAAQTEDELIRQGEQYSPDRYSVLGDRERMSKYVNASSEQRSLPDNLAETYPVPRGERGSSNARFQALDADHDGAIDQKEARMYKPLSDSWNQVDTNGNDAVDKVEFSAFESESQAPVKERGQGVEGDHLEQKRHDSVMP